MLTSYMGKGRADYYFSKKGLQKYGLSTTTFIILKHFGLQPELLNTIITNYLHISETTCSNFT